MPTNPPTHDLRDVAEGFGADAARYDRARPDYPAEMIDRIVAAVAHADGRAGDTAPAEDHVAGGPRVLDVGCGTGIAARQFQAAGCRVLGVDVDARMAELARRRGLDVEVSAFEQWDPAGRRFDAVVAGQTWHWVDPVAGAVKAAAALRPGGRIALFWNVFQPPAPLAAAFADVFRRVMPQLPAVDLGDALAVYRPMFTAAADGIRACEAFGEPTEWQVGWQRTYGRDEWVDQMGTHGGAGRLPPGTLADLTAGIGAAIDDAGGSFVMDYTTVAVTAARR